MSTYNAHAGLRIARVARIHKNHQALQGGNPGRQTRFPADTTHLLILFSLGTRRELFEAAFSASIEVNNG